MNIQDMSVKILRDAAKQLVRFQEDNPHHFVGGCCGAIHDAAHRMIHHSGRKVPQTEKFNIRQAALWAQDVMREHFRNDPCRMYWWPATPKHNEARVAALLLAAEIMKDVRTVR